LCRTKEAVRPYHVRDMGVRIYNLEELCYLVYNNIYVISRDFFSDGLLEFITEETGEKALADKLRVLKEGNSNLAEMVITLFLYVDYYTVEEIEAIRGVLETLNSQNVFERLKTRGDTYLENECFYSAIRNYQKIIDSPPDLTLPAYFYAKVYHNTGVAYARLFIFDQAEEYFNQAYKISQHDESKKCAIAVHRLALGDNIIERDDATELEYVVKRELETLMDNARYSDEYRKLMEISKNRDETDIAGYYDEVSKVLDGWKKDYVKYKS
jgi:tetratricopeptide (TPR) repeat protein